MRKLWLTILLVASPAFAGTGEEKTAFPVSPASGNVVKIDYSGRVVVAGNYGYPSKAGVARYLTSGALDTTFAGNGKAGTVIDNGVTISALDFGKNAAGKWGVIVGGEVSDSPCNHAVLIRYTDTGALDTTFNGSGKALVDFGSCVAGEKSVISSVRVDTDNSIVVAGTTTTITPGSAVSSLVVARFTSSGTLSASFGQHGVEEVYYGTSYYPQVYDLQLANGSIVVAGKINTNVTNGPVDMGQYPALGLLARFTSLGQQDTTFATSGTFNLPLQHPDSADSIRWLHVNGDDSIIFVGDTSYFHQGKLEHDTFLGAVTSSGQLDRSYGVNGIATVAALSGATPQYAGIDSGSRISIGSYSYSHGFMVSRVVYTGQLDTSYNSPHGYIQFKFTDGVDILNGLTLDSLGRAIACGATDDGDFGVARLTITGILDTSF